MSTYYKADWPPWPAVPPRRRRKKLRRFVIAMVILVAFVPLLVVGDRGAAGFAERKAADELIGLGFGPQPKVTIKGFPFLTQVLARHFHEVQVSATGVREGALLIANINVTARDVRLGSNFQSGTIGSVDGFALVTFDALARAAGQAGVTLSVVGRNRVAATLDLGVATARAIARVTAVGQNEIQVRTESIEGFPLSLVGNPLDFTVRVTTLPFGLAFHTLTLSTQGIRLSLSARNIQFQGGNKPQASGPPAGATPALSSAIMPSARTFGSAQAQA